MDFVTLLASHLADGECAQRKVTPAEMLTEIAHREFAVEIEVAQDHPVGLPLADEPLDVLAPLLGAEFAPALRLIRERLATEVHGDQRRRPHVIVGHPWQCRWHGYSSQGRSTTTHRCRVSRNNVAAVAVIAG